MKDFGITLIAQAVNTAAMNLFVLLFFVRVYQPKYESKQVYIISYFITTVLYILANILVAKIGILILNFLYTSIYVNIYCVCLFRCNYKRAFIINELFILFCLISEIFTTGFCTIINNNSLESILGSSQYITLSCLINILLMIVIWRVFILIFSKKDIAALKIRQILFFVIFTAFEAFSINNLAFKIEDRKDGMQAIVMVIGFLFLNAYTVYFIDESEKMYKTQYEYSLMQKQNQVQLDNFREISRKYEESRKTIHDIKKHLSSLKALGYSDKKRADEYGCIIEQKVDSLFYEFPCSNQLMSIIMSQKIATCRNEMIEVKTQIEDISFDYIEDFDITAIFANLWDNAIEACREVGEQRFIEIIIGKVNGFDIISFENSFNGTVNLKGDVFISTKENHGGVGLTIIKSAVEKYGGFLTTSIEDNIFKAEIFISRDE